MKRVTYKDSWPGSWKQKYSYDLLEIYGEIINRGYSYAFKNRFDHILTMVKAVAPRNTRVLDVAAGSGNFSLSLAEAGYKVVWNDLIEDLVEYVKQKYEYGEITYAPGNVLDLKFEQPFDVVLIAEIIEHVAYPNVFLQKIAQLVAPGGHIVMTTPNGHYFRNPLPRFSDFKDPSVFEQSQFGPNADDHIFALYLDEIYRFGKDAELEVIDLKLYNNALTSGHIKLENILKYLPRYFVRTLEKMTTRLPLYFKKKIHDCVAVLYRRKS